MYGGDSAISMRSISLVRPLVDRVLEAALARPDALRVLDRRREVDPAGSSGPGMLGYVCYADRFAGYARRRPQAPGLPEPSSASPTCT